MHKWLLTGILLVVPQVCFGQGDPVLTHCAAARELALVRCIKAELEANGQTFTTNEDAFQITRRVACIQPQARYIGKTPVQNGAVYKGQKYSHDALAFPLDPWRDILHGAGPPDNQNTPAWDETGASITVPTFGPIDCQSAPEPVPDPVPTPVPTPDLSAILARLGVLEDHVALLNGRVVDLSERVGAVTGRVQLLEARPIFMSCRANIVGIPISCKLLP